MFTCIRFYTHDVLCKFPSFFQGDSLSIRQAIDLGRAWGTSLDVLHRHHICELYTSGLDKLAEEVWFIVFLTL